jgi:hypothetical protein
LADLPVASPEESHCSKNRIDGSSASFVKQRLKQRRALVFRNSSYEAHETSPAEELCHKHSSMSLGISAVNPLKAWTKYTGLAASFAQDTTTIATHFQTISSSNNFVQVMKFVLTLAYVIKITFPQIRW